MRTGWSVLAIVGAVGGVSALAFGQMVTPPPATQPTAPEFELAPPPAPPPPIEPPPVQTARPRTPREPLPDLPYESLVKRDAAGALLPLNEPIEILALRRNPMLDDQTRARVEEVLLERRTLAEQRVLEHFDLIRQIDEGAIERTDFSNRIAAQQVVAAFEPLVAAPWVDLMRDLRGRNVLTSLQSRFNGRIVQEYLDAQLPAPDPQAPDEEKIAWSATQLRSVYARSFDEHRVAYRALLMEIGKNLGVTAEELGLGAAGTSAAAAFRAASADAERRTIISTFMGTLTPEQRTKLLEATIKARPPQ